MLGQTGNILVPLRIAAFPDLIAKEVIFAITSGRASNIIKRTPMGQVTLSRIRPSSSFVRKFTLPTVSHQLRQKVCNCSSGTHSDHQGLGHQVCLEACRPIFPFSISQVC